MSETVAPTPTAAPISVATPDASIPGPASGTPPEAAPLAPAAPAAFSPETPPEAPAEPVKPTSVLSEAKSEAVAEAEPEAPAEVKPAEVQPAEPAPKPIYEAFTLPEGVKLDEAQLGSFTGILGEFEQRVATDPTQAHAAAQEMGQKFLDLYLSESKAAIERQNAALLENWQRTKEGWIAEGKKDREIGGNRFQTTIQRGGAVLEAYGSAMGAAHEQALRDALGVTGAGDNPAMWRFLNWIAPKLVETSRPVPAAVPRAPVTTSRAQRLYRNNGMQG